MGDGSRRGRRAVVARGAMAGLVAFLEDLPRQIASALPAEAAVSVAEAVLNRLPSEVFVTVFRARLGECLDREGVLGRFRSLLDVLDDRALLALLDELGLRLAARGSLGVEGLARARDGLADRVFEEERRRLRAMGVPNPRPRPSPLRISRSRGPERSEA